MIMTGSPFNVGLVFVLGLFLKKAKFLLSLLHPSCCNCGIEVVAK
jgi:hypothetical protein